MSLLIYALHSTIGITYITCPQLKLGNVPFTWVEVEPLPMYEPLPMEMGRCVFKLLALVSKVLSYNSAILSVMKEKLTVSDYAKVVWFLLLGGYFLRTSLTPSGWIFLDGVNLIFHEAGHVGFMFFGEFIQIAGGTIMQLLIPAVVFFYFYTRREFFSSYIVLYWLGQSSVNVSVYAGDALTQQLPLLGGSSVMHDWHYLLSSLHLLEATPVVAGFFFWSGVGLYILATSLALLHIVMGPKNF